jgi:hypothetical protein
MRSLSARAVQPRRTSASPRTEGINFVSKNLMYFIIAIVVIGAAYIGYQYYLESQEGIDIEINSDGVAIDGK